MLGFKSRNRAGVHAFAVSDDRFGVVWKFDPALRWRHCLRAASPKFDFPFIPGHQFESVDQRALHAQIRPTFDIVDGNTDIEASPPVHRAARQSPVAKLDSSGNDERIVDKGPPVGRGEGFEEFRVEPDVLTQLAGNSSCRSPSARFDYVDRQVIKFE